MQIYVTGADLIGTNLSGADLHWCQPLRRNFSFNGDSLAMGLTQAQLDEARPTPIIRPIWKASSMPRRVSRWSGAVVHCKMMPTETARCGHLSSTPTPFRALIVVPAKERHPVRPIRGRYPGVRRGHVRLRAEAGPAGGLTLP